MGRAIVVMVSTLLFACFGLFVAWLNVQALLADNSPGFRRSDLIIFSYSTGPLLGAALGFSLSLFAMYLFTPARKTA